MRKEPNPQRYADNVAERKAAFAKYCFEDMSHTFYDPYWGGSAAEPDLGGIYLNTPAGSWCHRTRFLFPQLRSAARAAPL